MIPEYIPNIITVLRLLLVGPIVVSMYLVDYRLAFYLFIVAGVTDAVDGYLARRFHWISRFGAMVDPLADKLLMMSSYFTLAYLDQIPVSLLAMVLIRDVVIVTGGVCYHFLIGQYEFRPRIFSKLNTFLQVSLVILLLMHLAHGVIPILWLNILMDVVFATTLISMLDYVFVWGKKALNHPGGKYDGPA